MTSAYNDANSEDFRPALHPLGRVVYGAPFLVFGALHFLNTEMLAGTIPSWFPVPTILVMLTGAFMIFAGLSILFNRLLRVAGIGLALMLGIFIVVLHLPGVLQNDPMALSSLLKDVAIAGGGILTASLPHPVHAHPPQEAPAT